MSSVPAPDARHRTHDEDQPEAEAQTVLQHPHSGVSLDQSDFEYGFSAEMLKLLTPQPTAEGIAEFQGLYYAKTGKRVAADDAREALAHLIRFVLVVHLNVRQ